MHVLPFRAMTEEQHYSLLMEIQILYKYISLECPMFDCQGHSLLSLCHWLWMQSALELQAVQLCPKIWKKNKINCKIAFHLKYTKLAYWIFFKMYIENYYFSHLSRMEHIEMLLLLKAHIDIQDLSIITVDKFLR